MNIVGPYQLMAALFLIYLPKKYVCMYVRTYVRTYVRMYVCMYVKNKRLSFLNCLSYVHYCGDLSFAYDVNN